MMCPDKQMLSIYVDDELPSPWKEKFQAHLEQCPECQKRHGQYAALSRLMGGGRGFSAPEEGLLAAQTRVWTAFARRGGAAFALRGKKPAWRRSVSLPLPAACACAAALVAAALAVFLPASRQPPALPLENAPPLTRGAFEPPALDPFQFEIQAAPSVSSMDDIFTLIEAGDQANVVIIKLPEKKSYNRSGGPVLLRAVDYDNSGARGGRDR